ncbi:unnamed protein product [Symbiodinium sp. CCMP2592]|nr:unnamed protein product [Symbiodinium sp. CCMP2592]
MPFAKGSSCARCKRTFGAVPNPVVPNPAEGDVLQRRGNNNHCQVCFAFCSVHPTYKELSSKAITEKINQNQAEYDQNLSEYEATRRQGKRYKAEKSTTVSTETRQGISTKRILGYLYPLAALKKAGEEHLWSKLPRQTVQHMGRPVSGVLRETWGPGSIEVSEDSASQAVRSQIAAECEADEQEKADQAFNHLGQQLRLIVSEQEAADGGEAGLSLKASRPKPDEDQDDFMALWGVAPMVASSSASRSTSTKAAKDESSESTKPKRHKTNSAGSNKGFNFSCANDGNCADTASQPDQQQAPQGLGSSASWLFSMKAPSKGKAGKACPKVKEMETTEKLLTQHDQLKKLLVDDSKFLTLTYQKLSAHSDKLPARNTDDLQKVYRELSNTSTDGRACEVMKQLAAALIEIGPICEFISAFQDKESTGASMQSALHELQSTGIAVPASAGKMCKARLLVQHASACRWQDFLELMQSDETKELFGDDQDAFADFQAFSLQTALTNFLNQELHVPGFENYKQEMKDAGDEISAEEKEKRESRRNAAVTAFALEKTKQLHGFLVAFAESDVCVSWKDRHELSSWLEELNKLAILVDWAGHQDKVLSGEDVQTLTTARMQLVHKKSRFFESLTLFPFGQYIQQTCGVLLVSFLRDQNFKTELDSCIESCGNLRTFTSDSLFKQDTLEITVPGQAKVVDIVQKITAVQNQASNHFMQANEAQVDLVKVKIGELATAMSNACIYKFRKTCMDTLQPLLKTLVAGDIDADGTAKLVEIVNEAKNFLPVQQALLTRCLGTLGAEVVEMIQQNRTFWTRFSAIIPAVVNLMTPATVACEPGRLLGADILALMDMYSETKVQLLQKMCVDIWPEVLQIGNNIRRAAMLRLGKESQSFVQFVVFMSGQSEETARALAKDVVGEFQDEEDKIMVSYEAMFVHYGSHLPSDWSPMQAEVHVSSASLCAAGSALPLAKIFVHMVSWQKELVQFVPCATILLDGEPASLPKKFQSDECLIRALCAKEHEPGKFMHCLRSATDAAETIGHDMARCFAKTCLTKAPELFQKIVDIVKTEVLSTIAVLKKLHGNIPTSAQFIASLDKGEIDANMANSMCNDVSMQRLYMFLQCALEDFMGLKKVLVGISAAISVREIDDGSAASGSFSGVIAEAKAVIQVFAEFNDVSAKDATLISISSLVANTTMAQAITRELKVGETRPSLVNKALCGIRKRGWKLHPVLVQRSTAVLQGKAPKPAAK